MRFVSPAPSPRMRGFPAYRLDSGGGKEFQRRRSGLPDHAPVHNEEGGGGPVPGEILRHGALLKAAPAPRVGGAQVERLPDGVDERFGGKFGEKKAGPP